MNASLNVLPHGASGLNLHGSLEMLLSRFNSMREYQRRNPFRRRPFASETCSPYFSAQLPQIPLLIWVSFAEETSTLNLIHAEGCRSSDLSETKADFFRMFHWGLQSPVVTANFSTSELCWQEGRHDMCFRISSNLTNWLRNYMNAMCLPKKRVGIISNRFVIEAYLTGSRTNLRYEAFDDFTCQ